MSHCCTSLQLPTMDNQTRKLIKMPSQNFANFEESNSRKPSDLHCTTYNASITCKTKLAQNFKRNKHIIKFGTARQNTVAREAFITDSVRSNFEKLTLLLVFISQSFQDFQLSNSNLASTDLATR